MVKRKVEEKNKRACPSLVLQRTVTENLGEEKTFLRFFREAAVVISRFLTSLSKRYKNK